MPSRAPSEPPRPTAWLLRGFAHYGDRYLARHFHAVRLLGPVPAVVPPERPLVIYLNHPGWWDPLICLLLARHLFAGRASYAPIDAAMLGRYGFMERLGFFPVKQGSRRGAIAFLRAGNAILSRPFSALWLTPQGRFTDPRVRPVSFAPGLAHLARQNPGAVYLPLALEFPFWCERTPEALAHFGDPASGPEELEHMLLRAQERLAEAAIHQRPDDFATLLLGAAGEGGIYEQWRRLRARFRGEAFQRAHGREES